MADDPRTAVDGAGLVVCTTTTTTGYIALDWLAPGALVAHVSLDDVLPEVATGADLVVVDDWPPIAADDRRLFGRMLREGTLCGPGETRAGARSVDATLADVVAGRHPGRANDTDVVLSNPFGMGVLDVALAADVHDAALARDLGTVLEPDPSARQLSALIGAESSHATTRRPSAHQCGGADAGDHGLLVGQGRVAAGPGRAEQLRPPRRG